MVNLDSELARVQDELATARREEIRLGARIKGLEAERDALLAAASEVLSAPPAGLALASMTKDRAIVALLRSADRPMKIGEIVEGLREAGRPGEQYNGVSVYLDTLLKQRRVERPGRGLYTAQKLYADDDEDGPEAPPAA